MFQVNAFTEGFHDAVLMFAYAINKTRSQNKSLLDGGSITDNLKNVVIQGLQIPSLEFNFLKTYSTKKTLNTFENRLAGIQYQSG